METEAARARLPEAYQAILQLKDQSLSEKEIARRLQILPEAVGPLIRVAEAKLRNLQLDPIGPRDSFADTDSDWIEPTAHLF